ncbi:MAG TPA: adenylate kinase, partial [Candidatus Cloacimonetes bacterium]|nr:adenylate kinase [Candidatus Cloacimonadota bacterium]
PLIAYFTKKNVLHIVDGITSLEEVFKQIVNILE